MQNIQGFFFFFSGWRKSYLSFCSKNRDTLKEKKIFPGVSKDQGKIVSRSPRQWVFFRFWNRIQGSHFLEFLKKIHFWNSWLHRDKTVKNGGWQTPPFSSIKTLFQAFIAAQALLVISPFFFIRKKKMCKKNGKSYSHSLLHFA